MGKKHLQSTIQSQSVLIVQKFTRKLISFDRKESVTDFISINFLFSFLLSVSRTEFTKSDVRAGENDSPFRPCSRVNCH